MRSVLTRDRAVFLVFIISVLFLGYIVDRSSFAQVLLGYSIAFAAFFHFIERKDGLSEKTIWVYAIILRLALLFSLPKLSDDYFRFIWDGLVQMEGMSPFAFLPSAIQTEAWAEVYAGMNSKDYYSVYPPVMQVVFRVSAYFSGTNVIGNLIVMRSFIILSDVLLMWVGVKLLKLLDRPVEGIILFALNPLVIIECTGNLHFEGMMMAFTILGVFILMRQGDRTGAKVGVLAGLALSLGVLTKLTSLLALPTMFRRIGFLKTLGLVLFSLLIVALSFWPFLDMDTLNNMNSSLDLYFRNFQFNSSLYRIVDFLFAERIPHYRAERIGPWIAGSGMLLMGLLMLIRKAQNWEAYLETLLFVLSIHLLFASTVHPWYIVNLLVVSTFTRFRYPILWSFTAVFSYQFYDLGFESPFILIAEYFPVIAYVIWEMRNSITVRTKEIG
jgi:hypothetical protein